MKILNAKTKSNWESLPNTIYIGRPKGNVPLHWGNPFSHNPNSKAEKILATRELVVEAFWDWIVNDLHQEIDPIRCQWIRNNYWRLYGLDLVCWCSPLACHGDMYVGLLDTTSIKGFHSNGNDWASNFWSCKIYAKGWDLTFDSTEAAYQAAKCLNPEDRRLFVGLTASESKKLGRKIQLRPDWDQIKLDTMRSILRQKFKKGSVLADKLLATGGCYLEETNWWNDTYWGVCKGVGLNNLGKLLMEIREELRR